MLKSVTATNFYHETINGRNKPVLLSVLDVNTNEHSEVYTKFSAIAENGVNALITEAIAAMLAKDLELPIPEPVLVEIDTQFIENIQIAELAFKLKESLSIGFGSTKLPSGFRTWKHGEEIDSRNIQVAADVVSFDAAIQNPDRTPKNPNSLTDGNDIAIFDHDLAFITDVLFWKPPWEINSLNDLINNRKHIFFNSLKGSTFSYLNYGKLWKSKITDDRLNQYGEALPLEWVKNTNKSHEILRYLKNVRDNIDGVLNEVKRVLT